MHPLLRAAEHGREAGGPAARTPQSCGESLPTTTLEGRRALRILKRALIGVLAIGVWALVFLHAARPSQAIADVSETRATCEAVLEEALAATTDSMGMPMASRIGRYIEENCYISNGDSQSEVQVHCGTWHGASVKKWAHETN